MHTVPVIRDYTPLDKETVLNLLRLNTPHYFSPNEEPDFIYYLEHELEYYFVIEINKQVVGCGGFNFSGNPTIGKISWDILHPEFQGKLLGSVLVNYRLERLHAFKEVQKIIVRTSQLAYAFYEKQGFVLVETVEDYWAKGFHLYFMEYKN
jgi:ribosomal-protein-alanine N-acetyltransferase